MYVERQDGRFRRFWCISQMCVCSINTHFGKSEVESPWSVICYVSQAVKDASGIIIFLLHVTALFKPVCTVSLVLYTSGTWSIHFIPSHPLEGSRVTNLNQLFVAPDSHGFSLTVSHMWNCCVLSMCNRYSSLTFTPLPFVFLQLSKRCQ